MMFLNIQCPQERSDDNSRAEDATEDVETDESNNFRERTTRTVPSIAAQRGCFAVSNIQASIRDVALGAMDDTRKGPFFTCFDGPNVNAATVMRHGTLVRGINSAFFGADESGVGPIRAKPSRLKMSTPRCICITRNAVAVGYSNGAVRLWERKSIECPSSSSSSGGDYRKRLALSSRHKSPHTMRRAPTTPNKCRSKSCGSVGDRRKGGNMEKVREDLASGGTRVHLLAELGYHLNRNVLSIQASDDSFNQDLLISNSSHEAILWGQTDKLIKQVEGLKEGEALKPLWRKTLEHPVQQAAVLSFAQDSYLIACTQLHDVELFEQRGDCRRSLGRLRGHTGNVSCARFGSWGGISLFTGSYDGTIRLWTPRVVDQLLSIECVAVIKTSTNWIMDIALSHRQEVFAVSKNCVSVYSIQEEALSFAKNGSWLNGTWITNVGELEVKGGKGSALSYRWIGNVIVQKSKWYLYNMDVSDQGRTVHGWWGEDATGTCGQFKLTGTKGALEEDEFEGSFWRDCEEIKTEWRGKRCVDEKGGRWALGRTAATPSRKLSKSCPRSPVQRRGVPCATTGSINGNNLKRTAPTPLRENKRLSVPPSLSSSLKKCEEQKQKQDIKKPATTIRGRSASRVTSFGQDMNPLIRAPDTSPAAAGAPATSDDGSIPSSSSSSPTDVMPVERGIRRSSRPYAPCERMPALEDEQEGRAGTDACERLSPADNSYILSPLSNYRLTLSHSNTKPATEVALVERIRLPNPGTCVDVHFSGRRLVVGTVNGEICTYSSDWFHRRTVIMVRHRLLHQKTTTPEFLAFSALAKVYSKHGLPAGHWTQLPEELFQLMVQFI